MSFEDFIAQANNYGKSHRSFFFLIDFEQQKPLIFPLEEVAKKGIFFDIKGKDNVNFGFNAVLPDFYLSKNPMSLTDYAKGFKIVKDELQKGNSYLLNLTYPTSIECNYSLEQIFYHTSAKYKLLFDKHFVCFSPEAFIKIEKNKIFTYPMKGTIDANLPNAESILLNSQKEQREHYTIVDLMRNDLAIVAKNIEVTRFRYIEKIMTEKGAILQTSSEICGDLAENWQLQVGSILAKLLPAGSISGAPKQKTVEIIYQAEQQKRGYYTGIFGIFDGDSVESAVAIRFIEQKEQQFYFRSGGGITIQSELLDEYQELIQKVYVPLKSGDE
ncbi:aminodeoxychorismate synthase component I [Seminibacterium arietis]|uniref:Aminodeoxychorismate synthase component I n=1 Tax=Seminibacterium arietis TaxID=1173502 RepID=A0ABW3IB07_9PAST